VRKREGGKLRRCACLTAFRRVRGRKHWRKTKTKIFFFPITATLKALDTCYLEQPGPLIQDPTMFFSNDVATLRVHSFALALIYRKSKQLMIYETAVIPGSFNKLYIPSIHVNFAIYRQK
jgi:hypothetical protein